MNKNTSVFTFDYPVSASYADSYFAKVNTEGEEFWTSMKEAFYPYDCLMPMFGAAGNLEGQTLVNDKVPQSNFFSLLFSPLIR